MPNEFLDLEGLQKFKENISAVATQNKDGFMSKQDKDKLDNEVANRDEIIGENLIPYPYNNSSVTNRNGVDWTDLGNGFVKANGTASTHSDFSLFNFTDEPVLEAGTYTVSGIPEQDPNNIYIFLNWYLDGSYNKTSYFKGTTTFTLTDSDISTYTFRLGLRVGTGITANNAIFKPMLEKGKNAHDYQPYDLSRKGIVDQMYAENLIIYPYREMNKIQNGLVWDTDDKGIITVTSGTATGDSGLYLYQNITLEAGTYTLSGCPKDGSATTYRLQLANTDYSLNFNDFGDGVTFTLTTKTTFAYFRVLVKSGTTLNSTLSFKPMLEFSTISHKFQPYNFSRQEIIEQIIVDNICDSNFRQGWVRCASYSYENGKTVFTRNTDTSNACYFWKEFYLEKGKTYTVSANVNVDVEYSTTAFSLIQAFHVTEASSSYEVINSAVGYKNGRLIMTFTPTKDCDYIRINFGINGTGIPSGTEIIFSEIMLEEGDIAHPYQPYELSRQGLVDQMVVDNLLNYPYVNTTKTTSGITYTDNGNGTIRVSGTPTASNNFVLRSRKSTDDSNQLILPAGTYTVSGCPKGGSLTTYYIQVGKSDASGNWKAIENDYGDGFTFTLTEETAIQLLIIVDNDCPAVDVTFKPMVEVGTISHPYTQYNLSRQKLRKDIDTTNNSVYATCDTAAATAAKVITVLGDSRWELKPGATITVKFTNTNTAQNPTFNVNGTGAKSVWYNTALITTSNLGWAGVANRPLIYMYDGTQYVYVGQSYTGGDGRTSQTNTTTSAEYRLLLSTNANDTTETNGTRKSTNFRANPATGAFYAKGFNRTAITGQTLDVDTLTLSEGSPEIMRYICKTSGGSNNITNIPKTGNPFILDVELIRWASTTDYVTKQTFITVGDKHVEYVRYCTSGTWETNWTKRLFTDNNTTYNPATTSANGLMSKEDKAKLNMTNIAYGTCSTDAATSAKVVTIDGNDNWSLQKGSIIVVKFTNTNSASNVTFNVNNTGAKQVWYNTGVYTGNSNIVGGAANRFTEFIYDGTYWVWMGQSQDSNTTYSNASLGQGYGTCTTAESTAAKVVTLSNYALTLGGVVSVKFTYAVPANATMNINSKGAKNIFYKGSKITANVIKAGDIATFIYDGTQYHLISVDRGINNMLTTGDVVDNVTSTSTTLPLSAKQGKGLNDRVNNLQLHLYSLIRQNDIGALTNEQKTFTLFNGRKFSDYGTISITVGASSTDIRATCEISRPILTGVGDAVPRVIYLDCWTDNGTVFNQVAIEYVSDTQVKAYLVTSGTKTKYLNIYGSKVDDVAF